MYYRTIGQSFKADAQTAEPEARFLDSFEGAHYTHPENYEDLVAAHTYEAVASNPEDPNSQRIGLRIIEGVPGNGLTLLVPSPFTDDAGRPQNIHRLNALALATGARIIGIDSPSTGISDDLTAEQVDALKTNGDFKPVASSIWGALKQTSSSKVAIYGFSMGVNIGAALAATAPEDVEVEHLIAWESPSLEDQSTLMQGVRFVGEGMKLKHYQTHPQDEQLKRLEKEHGGIAQLPKRLMERGHANAAVYWPALSKTTTEDDLARALSRNPNMHLDLVNGSKSRISRTDANAEAAGRLVLRNVSVAPERIRHYELNKEGHSINDSMSVSALTASILLGARIPGL